MGEFDSYKAKMAVGFAGIIGGASLIVSAVFFQSIGIFYLGLIGMLAASIWNTVVFTNKQYRDAGVNSKEWIPVVMKR